MRRDANKLAHNSLHSVCVCVCIPISGWGEVYKPHFCALFCFTLKLNFSVTSLNH